MTDETKNILIAKMLDCPDTLTSDETAAIMGDEELRELYEISVRLQDSLQLEPQIDAQEEWNSFRQRLVPARKRLFRRFMRIAAVFVGVALVSGIAVKVIHEATPESRLIAVADCDSILPVLPETRLLVPDNGTLISGGEDISQAASVTPAPSAKEVTSKPGNPKTGQEMNVEEYIRIEQARIDNDVAMAMAQVYEDKYLASLEADMAIAMAVSPLLCDEIIPEVSGVENATRVIML